MNLVLPVLFPKSQKHLLDDLLCTLTIPQVPESIPVQFFVMRPKKLLEIFLFIIRHLPNLPYDYTIFFRSKTTLATVTLIYFLFFFAAFSLIALTSQSTDRLSDHSGYLENTNSYVHKYSRD